MLACDVCSLPRHALARLCTRCRDIRDRVDPRAKPSKQARHAALKAAWDANQGCFRCHYTGVPLVTDDSKSPRYLAFDHATPRNQDGIVVAAMAINDMKTDLDQAEFVRIVCELAKVFEGRGTFDPASFNLKHWKR